jgi:hypothetical protein
VAPATKAVYALLRPPTLTSDWLYQAHTIADQFPPSMQIGTAKAGGMTYNSSSLGLANRS